MQASAVAELESEGNIEVVSIPGRDDVIGYSSFVERHDLQAIPHIPDHDGALWEHFGVSGQPFWILFSPDGEVARGRGRLPS